MSLHEADIAARLKRFLDRRQAPRRVEGKPQAISDEITALVNAVTRNAPRGSEALAAWWPVFEARLGEAGSGLWPTEREIKDAAEGATKETPRGVVDHTPPDDCKMIAARMEAGLPVGEGWIYGADAVRLIAGRGVTEDVMRAYRSAAFLSRKATYGEDSALAWEAEAKANHERAKEVYRHRQSQPAGHIPRIPNKSVAPEARQ